MAHPSDAWQEEIHWLRGLALQLVSDPDVAEDLVQETALASIRRQRAPEPKWRGWRAGHLRGALFKRRRGEARRAKREAAVAGDEALPAMEDLSERLEVHGQVIEAILELDEPMARVVILRFFEDLSCAEIARRDGVPEPTVRSRLQRGLARLRIALDDRHRGDRSLWVAPLLGWLGLSGAAGSAQADISRQDDASLAPAGLPALSTSAPPTAITGGKALSALTLGALVVALLVLSLPDENNVDDRRAAGPGERNSSELANRDSVPDESSRVTGPAVPSAKATAEATATLRGQILDRHTGTPLEGATIRWIEEGEIRAETRSDAGGIYSIPVRESFESTETQLTIRSPNHVPRVLPLSSLRITGDGSIPPIALRPGVAWDGFVIDPKGNPRPGATVEVWGAVRERLGAIPGTNRGPVEAIRTGRRFPELITADERGRINAVLPPGPLFLHGSDGNGAGTTWIPSPERSTSLVPTFTLALFDGLASTTVLRGTIRDESGAPIAGARIRPRGVALRGEDGIPHVIEGTCRLFARSDDSGEFSLSLAGDAPELLVVDHPDFVGKGVALDRTNSKSALLDLSIELVRSRTLIGTLTPSEDASELPTIAALRLEIGTRSFRGVIDGTGRFSVGGLAPTDRAGVLAISGALDVPLSWPEGYEDIDLGIIPVELGEVLPLTLVDSEGQPIREAWARVDENSCWNLQVPLALDTAGPDGEVTLTGLPAGPVDLTVGSPDVAARTIQTESATPLTLTLDRAGILQGRMIREGGSPRAGALVELRTERTRATPTLIGRREAGDRWPLIPIDQTGPDGSFRFGSVPPGVAIELIVQSRGELPHTVRLEPVEPGETRDLGGLVVGGPAMLVFKISGSAADPIQHAAVTLTPPPEESPVQRSRLAGQNTFFTDENGSLAVGGLQPGPHRIEVRHPQFSAFTEEIEITSGITERRVLLEPSLDWRFRVVGRGGLPVAGAKIEVWPPMGMDPLRATSDAAGDVVVGPIPPGGVTLAIRAEGYSRFTMMEIQADQLPERVELSAGTGVEVRIEPLEIATTLKGVRVSLRGNASVFSATIQDPTKPFPVSGLKPGRYNFAIEAPGMAPHEGKIELAAGETLPIVYRPEPATGFLIRIVDSTGAPVAGSEVIAMVISEKDGGGRSSRLAETEPGIYPMTPPKEGSRVSLTVTPKDVGFGEVSIPQLNLEGPNVDVELQAAGTIELTILDSTGTPKADIRVAAAALPHGSEEDRWFLPKDHYATTDSAGRARFTGFAPGRVRCRLTANGGDRGTFVVEVGEGEVLEHTHRLGETKELAVRVIRDGSPLTSGNVTVVAGETQSRGRIGVDAIAKIEHSTDQGEIDSVIFEGPSEQLHFIAPVISGTRTLELKSLAVSGTLQFVDAEGNPVGGFFLIVRGSGNPWGMQFLPVGPDGRANYSGIPPGWARLNAEGLPPSIGTLAQPVVELTAGGTITVPFTTLSEVPTEAPASRGTSIFLVTESREWLEGSLVNGDTLMTPNLPAERRGETAWWVIERHGSAPTVHPFSSELSSPLSISDAPGGSVSLRPWPGERAPVRLRVVSLDGSLEAPLDSRAWRGTGMGFSLPVGRYRLEVEGPDSAGTHEIWSKREIEVRDGGQEIVEWVPE